MVTTKGKQISLYQELIKPWLIDVLSTTISVIYVSVETQF